MPDIETVKAGLQLIDSVGPVGATFAGLGVFIWVLLKITASHQQSLTKLGEDHKAVIDKVCEAQRHTVNRLQEAQTAQTQEFIKAMTKQVS